VTRVTAQREDASFAAFYLIALAAGVMIISLHGSPVDMMNVLFGSILAVDDGALLMVSGVASVSLLVLALIYRPLIAECFDPDFARSVGAPGGVAHTAFLVLVVLDLVAGFQALGTLMAVGLMMLPALAARFWAREVASLAFCATLIAVLSGAGGLLISYHLGLPSGPSVVLLAGVFYMLSLAFGSRDGLLLPRARRMHELEGHDVSQAIPHPQRRRGRRCFCSVRRPRCDRRAAGRLQLFDPRRHDP
jgi:zinc/manganese transport system permease protein